ncbi:hypothetical protein AMJ80_11595, partial [bacterium SM23_31]
EGTIDEDACYYYVDDALRNTKYGFFMYSIDKRYAVIRPDYVLLTPENLWYPFAGVLPYGAKRDAQEKHYIRFSLTVQTADNLTALSQGSVTQIKPGQFTFKPEVSLPQISLVIGNYHRSSVTADSIEYSLYVLEGHDYYSEFFSEIQGDIPTEISNARWNFELRTGLGYPFRRFALIETPIQFYAHPKLLTSNVEYVQPEQIYLPEKGVLLEGADISTISRVEGQQMPGGGRGGGRGRMMTNESIKQNIFRRFIDTTFLGGAGRSFMMRFREESQQGLSSYLSMLKLESTINTGLYSAFPMYYNHTFHFSSEQWSLFNTAVEYYLLGSLGNSGVAQRFIEGLTNQELASFALSKHSLADIIENPPPGVELPAILEQKCAYLFQIFEYEIGMESFGTILKDYLTTHSYSDHTVDEFLSEINKQSDADLKSRFDEWLYQNSLPSYVLSDQECYEIIQGEQVRYQVLFTIHNREDVDGLLKLRFSSSGRDLGGRFGRGGGGGAFGATEERTILVKGGDFKKVGIVLDSQPISMTVNTLLSQNLPSELTTTFQNIERNENAEPIEGDVPLDFSLLNQFTGTVIIDNENPGFTAFSQSSETEGFLMKYLTDASRTEYEYIPLNLNEPPQTWKKAIGLTYFGESIYSVHFKSSGKGIDYAAWTAELDIDGEYDIYFYTSDMRSLGRGMGRGGQGGGMQQFGGGQIVQQRGMGSPGGMQPQAGGAIGGQGSRGERQPQAGSGTQQTQPRGILDRLRNFRGRQTPIQDFHFTVHHTSGIERVKFDAGNAEPGWNLLGTFFFTQGKAVVELSDQSDGRIIYADALKWVIRK